MQVSAKANRLHISAQKARRVVDQVRGKSVSDALDILNFSTQKGAVLVRKVVESAIANAENNHDLDVDSLVVAEAHVGKALVMKRFQPRARGRVGRIQKPFSNLTVVVREVEETA